MNEGLISFLFGFFAGVVGVLSSPAFYEWLRIRKLKKEHEKVCPARLKK